MSQLAENLHPSNVPDRDTGTEGRLPALAFDLYTVQLLFDAPATRSIQSIKERLHALGYAPSIDPCPPHLTLGASEKLDLAAFSAACAELSAVRAPLTLEASSFGVFAGEKGYTIFLAPAPCGDLADLHRSFQTVFGPCATGIEAHYLPGSFVPHITLGSGISAEDLGPALAACAQALKLPLRIEIGALAVYALPGGVPLLVCGSGSDQGQAQASSEMEER